MKFDPELAEYGFYHVKRLKDLIPDNGSIYQEIVALNNIRLSHHSFAQAFSYAFDLYKTMFPNASDQSVQMGDILQRHFTKMETKKKARRPAHIRGVAITQTSKHAR